MATDSAKVLSSKKTNNLIRDPFAINLNDLDVETEFLLMLFLKTYQT